MATFFDWYRAFNRGAEVSPAARAVGNAMATRADAETLRFWITIQEVAEFTGISTRHAINKVDELARAEWVERTSRGAAGRASEYRLVFPSVNHSSPTSVNQSARNGTEESPGEGTQTCTIVPTKVNYSSDKGELECTPTTPKLPLNCPSKDSPLTPQGEAGSQATGGEQSVGQLALVPEVVDAEVVEDPPAKKRARNDYPPEFNEWWALYPWPDDKKNTYKQWKPAVRKVGAAFLMERLEVWLPSLRAQFEKDPQYVVRPWNWLKNDRYTANPPTPPRQNVSKAERIFHTGVDLVDQHQQYDQQQAVQQHYVPKELAW